MRKVISITQVTLDGVMQSPGGPEEDPTSGFTHGGWAMPFIDDAGGQVVRQTVAGEFDLLLGRRTYEIFSGYWPHHEDNPIGQAFNRAKKYVVTRILDHLDWQHSHRVDGDVVEKIRRLKAARGPVLHVWGSSELLQTLTAAGLIDEYRVWIFPLILGRGKRLFEPGAPAQALSLVDSQTTATGVMLNTYRPNGPVKRASFVEETPSAAERARRKKIVAEDQRP
jgi:dihydrofolate reductase